jgi:hypothetical protein
MDYVAAVTMAANALRRGEDSSWELARLTFEATVDGAGRPGNRLGTQPITGVTMAQWCRDVRDAAPGVKFSEWTGKTYKRIWDAYRDVPLADRPSWTEAYYEHGTSASPADRDRRATEAHLKQASPERKRELFERLRADPDVLPPPITMLPAGAPAERGAGPPPPAPDPAPVAVAQGALRLAVFVLDARVAAQHYAQALSEASLDAAGLDAEAAAIDTVLQAWERLRLILHAPGGIRLVQEVEDFLADARA